MKPLPACIAASLLLVAVGMWASHSFSGGVAFAAEQGVTAPAAMHRFLQQGFQAVGSWQRQLHTSLAKALSRGQGELIFTAALSVALGAIHALTPGHGKTVLATYLLGGERTPWRAFWLALRTAALHILSTVGMFLALYWAWVSASGLRAADAPQLRIASAAAIGGIGLWLVVRAVGHIARDIRVGGPAPAAHDHGSASRRSDWAISFAAGIVPCPLTTVLLLFTVQAGMIGASILVTLGMFLGIASTLASVCLIAVVLRVPLTSWLQRFPRFNAIAGHLVNVASGGVIASIGWVAWWGQVIVD